MDKELKSMRNQTLIIMVGLVLMALTLLKAYGIIDIGILEETPEWVTSWIK